MADPESRLGRTITALAFALMATTAITPTAATAAEAEAKALLKAMTEYVAEQKTSGSFSLWKSSWDDQKLTRWRHRAARSWRDPDKVRANRSRGFARYRDRIRQ